MRGSMGEKIGEGAWSDVHAWAPGQVVKLFKAGFTRRHSWWEARMTRAAFAAGTPAPEVFDEVTVEGRFGVVLQRLDGPTLLQLSRSGAITPEQTGAILANLAMSVHRTAPPPDVLPLRDRDAQPSRLSGGILPEHIATGILTLIERLAPADGLCHGDLHPDNVIMTAAGPRLIDWGGATRAPPGLDLACSHFLSEVAQENVPDPERPRANSAAMQSAYARLAGMSLAALTAAMEPYLPIIHVRFLLGPAANPALRARLIQRVEAALRSAD
jgi:aminoglycoside phosphotransferase (APT) family kinase protein